MKNKKNNISMMSEIKRKEHEAILKNSLIAILYLYKDRDIRWVNRRFTEMFGYTAKELEGRSVSIIHVDQQHFREFGEKYYTDLKFKNVNIDWPFKTKDGRVIICRVTGQAINRDNLEEGIIWLLDDISETVKAEEQLRKNKKLYEYLFHASIDAIFLMDSGGKLLKTNDAAGRLLGYTCDEFKKLHIEDIDIQFDRNAFKKFWSHKPIGESLIFETYHKHKNGGIIPVEVNGIVFEMDDNRYFYGIARNIQGRMKMTEELSKSEEKYRILAETAKDLIVMHDLKGRIHYANEYTLDVTGYSLKEMM